MVKFAVMKCVSAMKGQGYTSSSTTMYFAWWLVEDMITCASYYIATVYIV